MCVIAFASAGMRVKMSSLKNCFDSNPHGAGIMWRDGTAVHVHKGFMSWEAFAKAYNEVPVQFDRAFHFRIMSSGEVKPENCHPFTVDMERVLTYTTTRLTIMHNGVMHEYEDPKLPWPDTVNYLRKNEKEFPNMPQVWGNKFLFMTPTQTVMIGDGWEMPDDENVWYSNNSYEDCSWDVDWYRVEKKHEDKFGFVDEPKEDTTGDFPLDECSGDCHTCKHWSECWTGEKDEVNEDSVDKDTVAPCDSCRGCKDFERCWYSHPIGKNKYMCQHICSECPFLEIGDEDHPEVCTNTFGECEDDCEPAVCIHNCRVCRYSTPSISGDTIVCGYGYDEDPIDFYQQGYTPLREYKCPKCGTPLHCVKDEEDENGLTKWVCPKPSCQCVYNI